MKRKNTGTRFLAALTALGVLAASCSSTDNRDTYLGTMAGADIGGTVGEAIGWILTDRHDGPGKAMAGSILGTVAGAVIGNRIGAKSAENKSKKKKKQKGYDDDDTWYGSRPSYQTSGGQDAEPDKYGQSATHSYNMNGNDHSYSFNRENCPQIGKVTYQDEDGDGRFSAYETINVIYEVTNNSSQSREVELTVREETDPKSKPHLVCSPTTTTTLAAGETIRYKAKVFLKERTKEPCLKIRANARFKDGTENGRSLQIRCAER